MNMQLSRGCLVAFEGIDGTGKSTQVKCVAEALEARGFEVVQTCEPTNGPHGQEIRASALEGRLSPERELELFMLDREEHVRDLILPALEAGCIVLTDRYYFSTLAYQGARGFDVVELRASNEAIAPPPDLLVIFELPVERAIERILSGRGESQDAFEGQEMLEACAAVFEALGAELPYAHVVDATRAPARITEEILDMLAAGPLRGVLVNKATDTESVSRDPDRDG